MQVQEDLARHVGAPQAAVLKKLSGAVAFRAGFKRSLAVRALADPWAGLLALERHGHRIARLARSRPEGLPFLIEEAEAGMDRAADPVALFPYPTERTQEAHMSFLAAVLEQARQLREKALRRVSREDRRFLFDHAAALVERFSPQVSGLDEPAMSQLKADQRFCRLVAEQVDYAALATAAQVLARLADDDWLLELSQAVQGAETAPSHLPGVAGDVLLVRETPYGLIVIGGPGPNAYDLDERSTLVIDMGGDDTYRGVIAAATGVEHGISVVVDLSGNDTYQASPLGLATGRLGVGLLIDRSGDDAYRLAPGTGGAGFAGLGVLYDAAGHDQYIGARFTQGAAVGGLGLLLDLAGNDTHTSFGYAVGFGGPLGVGAVIDVAGDDRYQCGDKYPSDYNAVDLPDGGPGDPRFQYECFGLGTGSGTRIYPDEPGRRSNGVGGGLAGGLGMFLDLDGDDRYRSSNFSQGCGYFFGLGLKLDMGGNDEHGAARYGHGAGAHSGVGLFVDYGGDDRYTSTGPHYNGGTAWDASVASCIDAGRGHDVYDLGHSDGLGRADYRSWSLFIEEGGGDRYLAGGGMGMASHDSMSGFFDLAGEDEYVVVPRSDPAGAVGRGNGRTLLDGVGGIFVDRAP